MSSSNTAGAALFILSLVTGGVGFIIGRNIQAGPALLPAPPVVVGSSSVPQPGAAVQYVAETGMLYVVKDSEVYKLDAKSLDLLDMNSLDRLSLPFAVRRARNKGTNEAMDDERAEHDDNAKPKWTHPVSGS